ncbi:His-Xaa-Ser system radical SAM maturase HxsC [Mesorhizobium sp. IMUNJ 23232]|uniref:His-Xaa-Ser system radical SAM maturase HxsC n=1 Tax=Mesorhizobium sp. IMUNJ 23232 TaxID=3376064 RepID=UPI003794DA41
MISLRLKAQVPPIAEPLILRLRETNAKDLDLDKEAVMIGEENGWRDYDYCGFSLRIEVAPTESLDGDVLLAVPGRASVHRLIRSQSRHNTLLITERCDQLCVMCSQPPKAGHADLFPQFTQAVLLAPAGATVGLSGGEPLLYKDQLFDLIETALSNRPDLRFHVLTNGQHFESGDKEWLRRVARDRVLWGIPIYAPTPEEHDAIVAKEGAFHRLMESMPVVATSGARIELRTVVTARNVQCLPSLATLITTVLPFCSSWAVMQLEPIGFGRMNWDALFHDNSVDFEPIARAMNIALARGVDVALFNFPLCTVPEAYRIYAPATISDWKQKFLEPCAGCSLRARCGGFFEWYDPNRGFAHLGLT